MTDNPNLVDTLNPNDPRMSKTISKKAHFPFSAGASNQAKWLIMYARWNHTSYPQYTGTWSPAKVVVIG